MVDVIGNISMVKAFGGLSREHRRFDTTVAQGVEQLAAGACFIWRGSG